MVTHRGLTPEEAREKVNEIGLDRVSWDGLLLSLILKDGTSVEISGTKYRGEGNGSAPLCFTHRLLRIFNPTEKY